MMTKPRLLTVTLVAALLLGAAGGVAIAQNDQPNGRSTTAEAPRHRGGDGGMGGGAGMNEGTSGRQGMNSDQMGPGDRGGDGGMGGGGMMGGGGGMNR